jgi:cell division protein FtsW
MATQTKSKAKSINKSKVTKSETKTFDFILFATVLLLLAVGIVMVLSASSPSALSLTGSSYTYVSQQFIAAGIGIVAMLIISRIDYKEYAKFYKVIYAISVIILFLVLVPGLGREVNGARRWITLPILRSFQPSELTKIGLIIFYAAYLMKYKDNLKEMWKGFLRPILLLLPVILVLLFAQSHFSAVVIIVSIVAVMMLMAGSRMRYFLTFGTIGVTGLLGRYVCFG